MPNKVGRPKKDIKKDVRITIRLTEVEYELLEKLCAEEGLTRSEAIVKALKLYYISIV